MCAFKGFIVNGNGIIASARRYLGRPYQEDFTCLDFVRAVYAEHGLSVPPASLNLDAADLADPPIGFVLYLRRKAYIGTRTWTHMVLIASATECIHCSRFFGGKVVLTPLRHIRAIYEVT